MKCAVAIFAKTIGLSDVKTRLAADIGRAKAEEFYRLSVDCVEAFVGEAGEAFPEALFPVWVLAEEDGPAHWNDRSYPAIWTGEGELGSRLANVSETLFGTYDAVMLIGTDSPQLNSGRIVEAMSILASGMSDVVAGPAADGGFYLFGSSKAVPREIWESVEYSCSSTLSELLTQTAASGITTKLLDTEQDVDIVDDLKSLYGQLKDMQENLSAPKAELREWLADNTSLLRHSSVNTVPICSGRV